MRQTLRKFGAGFLRPINTSAVLILGVYTALWGIWIGNPYWDVFDRAQLFSAMSTFAGEVIWGCMAIAVGLVTSYGAFEGKPPYIYWGAAAAGVHWFTISIFYFLGDWQNTGGITSLTIAVYAAFVYANVKVNYEYDDLPDDLNR